MGKRGRPRHPDVLTPREWEVLGLVREELSNEAIAARLGISLDGVKYHVSEILGKLGVENRADAARWQPEARRWWAIAPLGLLRARWLSPPIAAALALVVLAAIGVLVWALVATRGGDGAAVPVALASGDRLAYAGTDEHLWLLEAGRPARRLTAGGAGVDDFVEQNPIWSPDGRYIMFQQWQRAPGRTAISIPSLWLFDTQTDAVRRVEYDFPIGSAGVSSALWAPDSRRLAFIAANALWTGDLEGNVQEVLPAGFGVDAFAWSPDGTELAIAHSLSPTYPEDINAPGATVDIPEENGVYVVDAAGGDPRALVLLAAMQRAWDEGEGRGPPTGQPQALAITGVDSVTWSPDGNFVAFQPITLSASLMADGVPLFTVPATGGEPAYHGIMLRSYALLDWFPGSHRFVFTLGEGREVYTYKCLALGQAGVAGSDVLWDECAGQLGALTPDLSVRSDAWPAVSPDGERIVFQASEPSNVVARLDVGKIEGPREGIWVADADGSNARQLTSDPAALDFFPRWSADGELIVFLRTTGDRFVNDLGTADPNAHAELWIMRSDGSGARLLLDDVLRIGSYYGLFAWEQVVAWWPSTDGARSADGTD